MKKLYIGRDRATKRERECVCGGGGGIESVWERKEDTERQREVDRLKDKRRQIEKQ